MYVLGIDGGGTKTKGIIANSSGEIAAEAMVGASNPNSVSEIDLIIELEKLFSSLQSQFKGDFSEIKHVFAGMSGVDQPAAKEKMIHLLASILPDAIPITVNNDAITALYSGTLGKPGIVQIAGTGSITFGLSKEEVLSRLGGWGYLIGDQGSGFSIGSDALEAAFAYHDGVGKQTVLKDFLLQHFQVHSLPDIIPFVYQVKNVKEVIASLSRLVMEAVDQGDAVAKSIIESNAIYLGESIASLIKKLFDVNDEIPVVLVGGLFNRFDLFEGKLQEIADKHGLKANFILPQLEPVAGAVVAALKELGLEVNEDFAAKYSRDKR